MLLNTYFFFFVSRYAPCFALSQQCVSLQAAVTHVTCYSNTTHALTAKFIQQKNSKFNTTRRL